MVRLRFHDEYIKIQVYTFWGVSYKNIFVLKIPYTVVKEKLLNTLRKG